MIAAGVGCRQGCSPDDLIDAVNAALAQSGHQLADVSIVCAPVFKAREPALTLAAAKLDKQLVWLSRALLEAQTAAVLTSSRRVFEYIGLPSVSEAAALAGACSLAGEGASARLLGPRTIVGRATCALAQVLTEKTP